MIDYNNDELFAVLLQHLYTGKHDTSEIVRLSSDLNVEHVILTIRLYYLAQDYAVPSLQKHALRDLYTRLSQRGEKQFRYKLLETTVKEEYDGYTNPHSEPGQMIAAAIFVHQDDFLTHSAYQGLLEDYHTFAATIGLAWSKGVIKDVRKDRSCTFVHSIKAAKQSVSY